ncbi:MAG: CorA family divalent cation transporter [Cognaticolwellia sp.]
MKENTFIIDAWQINGPLSTNLVNADELTESAVWLHCDRTNQAFSQWLTANSIDESIIESLLATDTRPRFQRFGSDSFLLILRGVNLNKGKAPDDMLTIRMLYTPDRLITCNAQHSKAIASVLQQLQKGQGPEDVAALIIEIFSQINAYIEDVLEPTEDFIDGQDSDQFDKEQIADISAMHKKMLKLNRFLKPQIHALSAVSKANIANFSPYSVALANQVDVLSRIVESIDFYIAQIDVINARINQCNTELMNRNTYILSIIAGIFLPLGFLTGLFGINIGGMPGVDNSSAFYWFCGLLSVIGLLEFLLFRRLKFL